MSMSVNTTANVGFKNNVELALNQHTSKLRDTIQEDEANGAERHVIKDIIGNVMPQVANERHGDTKYVDTPHDRVHIAKPDELYFAELVDRADQLATLIDLKGAYTMAATATINRSWDDQDLAGIYGSMITGKDGTTINPFPNGQIVPVTTGGASGPQRMNVAKMRAANKMLMQGYADVDEDKYMILDAEQIDDLLSEVPATSNDFKGAFGGEFRNGVLVTFLGFKIIQMELRNPQLRAFAQGLTIDGSGYTKNPFWVKSGLRRAVWDRLITRVDPLPTKLYSTQVFAGTTVATTRVQTGKVGIILNSEA